MGMAPGRTQSPLPWSSFRSAAWVTRGQPIDSPHFICARKPAAARWKSGALRAAVTDARRNHYLSAEGPGSPTRASRGGVEIRAQAQDEARKEITFFDSHNTSNSRDGNSIRDNISFPCARHARCPRRDSPKAANIQPLWNRIHCRKRRTSHSWKPFAALIPG